MENKDYESISFELISKSGSAFSLLVEALMNVRNGNYEVEDIISQAKALMDEAHNMQTRLVTQEAQGNALKMGVLLVHAQDHLMNCVLMFTIVEEFIQMYKEMRGIKDE